MGTVSQGERRRVSMTHLTPLTSLTSLTSIILLVSQLPLLSAQCSSGQWQCADNSCLLREKVCDSRPDCPDGSDEAEVCERSDCPEFLFSCGRVDQCVSQVRLCNGGQDCRDNSDELQPQCRHQHSTTTQPTRPQASSTSIISSSCSIIILIVATTIIS